MAVEFEFRPEPSEVEREAVSAALERLLAGEADPSAYRSAWRAAGVRDNIDVEPVQAIPGPRRSRGATRA